MILPLTTDTGPTSLNYSRLCWERLLNLPSKRFPNGYLCDGTGVRAPFTSVGASRGQASCRSSELPGWAQTLNRFLSGVTFRLPVTLVIGQFLNRNNTPHQCAHQQPSLAWMIPFHCLPAHSPSSPNRIASERPILESFLYYQMRGSKASSWYFLCPSRDFYGVFIWFHFCRVSENGSFVLPSLVVQILQGDLLRKSVRLPRTGSAPHPRQKNRAKKNPIFYGSLSNTTVDSEDRQGTSPGPWPSLGGRSGGRQRGSESTAGASERAFSTGQ